LGVAEDRLNGLGIALPSPDRPVANYVTEVRVGSLLFLSGAGPAPRPDRAMSRGKLGREMSVEQGYEAARSVGLVHIARLKALLGELDRVARIVKVLGMVNCVPDFVDQPAVVNGFSDLMVDVFGERGRHARSAVGMATLPFSIPVEVEMVVEIAG